MMGFVGAIQFLTRIPLRLPAPVEFRRAAPWFPLVGVFIGAVVGGVVSGLGELVPPGVAAIVGVTVGLLITGAFHEDGLADIADAFGGGVTVDARLEILKDPRHGTYGVTAIATSIMVRVMCVASIAGLESPALVFASLVAAHTLGRSAAVVALLTVRPARATGLAADAATDLRMAPATVGTLAAVVAVVVVAGWWVLPFVAAALVGFGVVVWLTLRKISGLVGDVLGAIEQVVECLVLIVASGLATRYQLWWP